MMITVSFLPLILAGNYSYKFGIREAIKSEKDKTKMSVEQLSAYINIGSF